MRWKCGLLIWKTIYDIKSSLTSKELMCSFPFLKSMTLYCQQWCKWHSSVIKERWFRSIKIRNLLSYSNLSLFAWFYLDFSHCLERRWFHLLISACVLRHWYHFVFNDDCRQFSSLKVGWHFFPHCVLSIHFRSRLLLVQLICLLNPFWIKICDPPASDSLVTRTKLLASKLNIYFTERNFLEI